MRSAQKSAPKHNNSQMLTEPPPFEPPLELPDAGTDDETALLLATLLLVEVIDEEDIDELDVGTLEALDVEDALEESVELILCISRDLI